MPIMISLVKDGRKLGPYSLTSVVKNTVGANGPISLKDAVEAKAYGDRADRQRARARENYMANREDRRKKQKERRIRGRG